ncbi:MAG: hypothetical protein Q7J01_02435, partial [Syntrophales bacterium]|nr:hypothetical protein [Syntrophales bacterium]
MEKRVIKKDALAGIIKKMAETTVVYAPVRDEDNLLFKVLEEGMEPLLDFDNAKNAPKNFFFPQTEVMMRYMRTERGKELSTVEGETQEAVLFGVRPCDARSFALLDNLFNDPKYQDPYYIERREKTTIVSLACVHPPYTTCFCTSVDGHPLSSEGADVCLIDMGDIYLAEFVTPKG